MKNVVTKSVFGVVVTLLLVIITTIPASAVINPQINFQGKITNPDGTNIANGSYSVRFRIYTSPTADALNACTANSCSWEETKSLTVTDGIFQTALGDTTALPGNVDFNTNNIYLGIKVGTDAEMTPRVRFTASPYAFNSEKVGGFSASQLVQLSPGAQQTGSINVSGTITTASTLAVQGSNAVTLGSTANVGAILFQDGTANNRTVTLNVTALPTASYSLTLPTSAPGLSQCLQSGSSTASQLIFGACSAGGGASSVGALNGGTPNATGGTITSGVLYLQSATDSLPGLVSTGAQIFAGNKTFNNSLTVTSNANVPTTDQVVIDNSGSAGVATAGVNGLYVKYKGGAANVEASGVRIDVAPGSTSGGIWSGLRIAATAGAATGVTQYGIKLEGPASPGAGDEEAIYIGSGWDIGLDIQSGGIQLATQDDPAAPAAGNLRLYAKSIAGRMLPKWTGPAGVDTPVQANLGFNRVSFVTPAGGTTLTTFVSGSGTLFTNLGAANNPNPTSTNLLTSTRRATFSTTATAGNIASHRQNMLQVWRGNASNLGGFFYTIRFGTETLATTNRAFIGLSDSTAAPTNADPTLAATTTPGKMGVAMNASTGNWKFVTNATGTAPSVTDLGATLPILPSNLYELIIFCPPNGSTVTYRMTNLSTNVNGNASVTGVSTTNIPSNTTFVSPQFWISNGTTAAVASLAFNGWYLESDN